MHGLLLIRAILPACLSKVQAILLELIQIVGILQLFHYLMEG